jgi:flagellar hook protein FlgE
MRLESALFSSREGLTAHGQAISVIGDNISNANTTGFKGSRVEFADLLSNGGGANANTEKSTSGSGVAVRSIRQSHQGGVIESTGRSLDVGIGGNGFFILGDGDRQVYTRAGNFGINADGILVNSDGLPVLGYPGDFGNDLGPLDMTNFERAGTVTGEVNLFGNVNSSLGPTDLPVDPESFREIAQTASFMSSARVFDSLGEGHDVTLAFFKTDVNTWTAQAYIDGSEVGGEAGVPVQIGNNAVLNFTEQGLIAEENAAQAIINANPAYANGAAAGDFAIDLSGFSQFAGGSQINSVTQDGQGAGDVTDYEVRSDGQLFAVLDSGSRVLVGTIPLATFTNLDGLQRTGNTIFAQGTDVGEVSIGRAGEGSFGPLQGSALELSTVDIATQFVDLILYQRGYQASSQTLNAASELLRSTIQLIR